jgi:hypothetical protein
MSLSAHGSYFENFGEPTLVDVRVILLVEDDKMDGYIHPHIELETLKARMVYMGMDNMVILFPLSNNDTQTKVRIYRTWLDSIFFHHLENSMMLFT